MYLNLDVKSMMKLYESNLGNIDDNMILSEVAENNYDPIQVFELVISDKFTRRLDYNVKDEYYNFKKLLGTVRIRRKLIRRNLFLIKEVTDNLQCLRSDNEDLFNLYFTLIDMDSKLIKDYSFDPRGDIIDNIMKPLEAFLKTNNLDMFEAGNAITILMKEFSISPELSMLMLYSFTNLEYYSDSFIRYISDKNSKLVDIDKFDLELSNLMNSGILSYKIDGFIEMIKSIDKLIDMYGRINEEEFMAMNKMKSYNIVPPDHIFKLRDTITRFIMEKNL